MTCGHEGRTWGREHGFRTGGVGEGDTGSGRATAHGERGGPESPIRLDAQKSRRGAVGEQGCTQGQVPSGLSTGDRGPPCSPEARLARRGEVSRPLHSRLPGTSDSSLALVRPDG